MHFFLSLEKEQQKLFVRIPLNDEGWTREWTRMNYVYRWTSKRPRWEMSISHRLARKAELCIHSTSNDWWSPFNCYFRWRKIRISSVCKTELRYCIVHYVGHILSRFDVTHSLAHSLLHSSRSMLVVFFSLSSSQSKMLQEGVRSKKKKTASARWFDPLANPKIMCIVAAVSIFLLFSSWLAFTDVAQNGCFISHFEDSGPQVECCIVTTPTSVHNENDSGLRGLMVTVMGGWVNKRIQTYDIYGASTKALLLHIWLHCSGSVKERRQWKQKLSEKTTRLNSGLFVRMVNEIVVPVVCLHCSLRLFLSHSFEEKTQNRKINYLVLPLRIYDESDWGSYLHETNSTKRTSPKYNIYMWTNNTRRREEE